MSWDPNAGGPATKVIDLVPSSDITYGESGGALTGAGIFEGWKVNNWAGFTHIKDIAASTHTEVKLNVSGQLRPDVLNSWLTDTPYIYMPVEVTGDFDVILECDVWGSGDLDKTIAVAVGYPDSVTKTFDHFVGMRWGAWNAPSGKASWMCSASGNNPQKGTGATINYGTPYYLRISREGTLIRFRRSTDGAAWTEDINAGGVERDQAGSVARICIKIGRAHV